MAEGIVPVELGSVEVGSFELDGGEAMIHLLQRGTDAAPPRSLTIWVGGQEAALVSIASTAQRSSRPLTHDVVQRLLQAGGLQVERAVITAVRADVFHAELTVITTTGRVHIDCRPADAIAIAIREGAGLFVAEALMEQEGVREQR